MRGHHSIQRIFQLFQGLWGGADAVTKLLSTPELQIPLNPSRVSMMLFGMRQRMQDLGKSFSAGRMGQI